MNFFESLDVFDVIENNVTEFASLQDSEIKKLLLLYRKVKVTIAKRLRYVSNDTFTAQQLRATLIQIEFAISQLENDLAGSLADITDNVASMGVGHMVDEVAAFSEEFTGAVMPLDVDVGLVVQDTSNFLFNRFEASIANYGNSLRQKIATGLAEMVTVPTPLDAMVRTIGNFFDGESWQILRIARTELHNIYSFAKLNGMKQADVGLKKTLYHPKDARTGEDSIFLMSHAKQMIKNLNEPFEYWWNGKARRGSFDGSSGGYHRVFQNPPDRPNDRSVLIPYHPGWE